MILIKSIGDKVVLRREVPTPDGGTRREEFALDVLEASSLVNSQHLLQAVIDSKAAARQAMLDKAAQLEKEARELKAAASSEEERQRLRKLFGAGMLQ